MESSIKRSIMESETTNKNNGARKGASSLLRRALFFFVPLLSLSLTGCNWKGTIIDHFFPSSSSSSLSSPSSSSFSSSSLSNGEAIYTPISFHFLSLGNLYNGDSIYVKAGETDILIDAGSRKNSASTIKEYIDRYCLDGKLEYVIATHAHQDHIAGFVGNSNQDGDEKKPRTGILYEYKVDTLIDFSFANSDSGIYKDYCSARGYAIEKGTKHFTAKECYEETDEAKRVYSLGDGLSMRILYQKAYDAVESNENNNSVCLLFEQGDKKMLFTGDLEESGCKSLLESNPEIGHVDLFKGGHHGSKNANPDFLLSAITPKTICTCCVAGSNEYTDKQENTMPYQETIDQWAKYTDEVYLTSYAEATGVKGKIEKGGDLNGNIEVRYDATGLKTITGSNNSTKLKDTEWMKNNRKMPKNWLNSSLEESSQIGVSSETNISGQ